ncbi:endoplasmic oxidoreductin [Sodiomyces alkalinus F11]|uniref:Endoplasmic oxidoreductin n=1 Tax=Sodiomyces alkalinus (strain CBS 110278 / VKM F-3762 / F11) TaxID=1314773 RepID=A0A3N2PZN9_SODAK|nr:endoplasmic oxidoreductin [Sodiomyces alkalinus F11]ROT39984.1 endoplasmic oxidoreductin [Sodiomyces alkalinus F11]
MKSESASRLFYLSLFALWASPGQCDRAQDDCAISPKAIVSDACASYATLDKLNGVVKPALDDLTTTTDFFSHYRLNLFNKKCPFWDDENGMCGNIACAVETLDNEEDIPEVWRSSELGKLEGPVAKHPGRRVQKTDRPLQDGLGADVGESCVFEYDDECDERDYCVPEDESAASKGDYVSLLRNPERFTGYSGFGASQIWDAIYRENCFQRSSFPHSAALGQSSNGAPFGGPAVEDLKQVLEAAGRQQVLEQMRETHPNAPFVAQTGLEAQDECLEKRVFYRVISGMHASISTHLCWDFLNQTTGQWQPNLACYVSRLHSHPDRISNLYFNYALVARAVAKLGPYLQGEGGSERYTFCTGDPSQDADTRAKVLAVTEGAASEPRLFDESLMFKNGEGPSLKEDFRNRFRNVSRVMDCVGCDKCRLWGKLQTAGYGTALKILFEFGGDADADGDGGGGEVDVPRLKRTELVALFNTYARISGSLAAIGKFRAMYEAQEASAAAAAAAPVPIEASTRVASLEASSSLLSSTPHSAAGRAKKTSDGHGGDGDGEDEKEKEEGEEAPDDTKEVEDPPRITRRRRRLRGDESWSEIWRVSWENEFGLATRATKLVLRQWVRFPLTLWEIISTEATRLGQYWLGLPMMPRTWKIERPNLDEL